LVRGFFF